MFSFLRRLLGGSVPASTPTIAFRPLLTEEEVAAMDAAYWAAQPAPYVCTYTSTGWNGAITFSCRQNVHGKGLFCPSHRWAEIDPDASPTPAGVWD